jgi:hypothetical protein
MTKPIFPGAIGLAAWALSACLSDSPTDKEEVLPPEALAETPLLAGCWESVTQAETRRMELSASPDSSVFTRSLFLHHGMCLAYSTESIRTAWRVSGDSLILENGLHETIVSHGGGGKNCPTGVTTRDTSVHPRSAVSYTLSGDSLLTVHPTALWPNPYSDSLEVFRRCLPPGAF